MTNAIEINQQNFSHLVNIFIINLHKTKNISNFDYSIMPNGISIIYVLN